MQTFYQKSYRCKAYHNEDEDRQKLALRFRRPDSRHIDDTDKQQWSRSIAGRLSLFLGLLLLVFTVSACQSPATNNNQDKSAATTTSAPDISETDAMETGEPDSSGDRDPDTNAAGFSFIWESNKIELHQPVAPVLTALGEPLNYFEAESCAFEGIDKIYTYGSLEISTVPYKGEDTISQIVLLDDTAETAEGLYIGASKDAMIAAYGDAYEVKGSGYIYTKDNTQLMFIVDNNVVAAIEYIAVFDS